MNQDEGSADAPDARPLSAAEAAAELGITRATLYAYVSRGLLRSEPGADSRSRRYPRADVEALKRRQEAARPREAAEHALDWGLPVLDSALTRIAGGALAYRGHDAIPLARGGETLERVAALLWLGSLDEPLPAATEEGPPWRAAELAGLLRRAADLRPFDRMRLLLAVASAESVAAEGRRPEVLAGVGLRLVHRLAAAASGPETVPEPAGAAATLARAWSGGRQEAERLVRAALVLTADHELNVSAFTARCVASAGAPLEAAVAAGLAALGGPRHGGHCDRVEALFEEAARVPSPRSCVEARLRRGEAVPGFGHRLYPDGDPRGALLLTMTEELAPGTAQAEAAALAEAAADLLGERPTIDFGLVAAARALGLPPGAALALFAVGRSVGWIAHALEQYRDGRMIRPRARYVGPHAASAGAS
jgi:citrate synthase